MINPRSIALEGIGFGPALMALAGFGRWVVAVRPPEGALWSGTLRSGVEPAHEDEIEEEDIFIFAATR